MFISAGLLHWVFDNIGKTICFISTAFTYASKRYRQIDKEVLFINFDVHILFYLHFNRLNLFTKIKHLVSNFSSY